MDKYLLLMLDSDTGNWHINVQTENKNEAFTEHGAAVSDKETKAILIYTGDFLQ